MPFLDSMYAAYRHLCVAGLLALFSPKDLARPWAKLKPCLDARVVLLAFLAATACGHAGNHVTVWLGGVIEVSYEVGSHAWVGAAEWPVGPNRLPSQTRWRWGRSGTRNHGWAIPQPLSCLRRKPHVLAVALPR